MTKIQKAKTYECALHVAHNDEKLNIVVKDYCTPLAVVPGEQSERNLHKLSNRLLWMNKLTHNQENRFQTGLTHILTLRTAVIHEPIPSWLW